MSRANIGIYGEELYEQVLPLHGPDPDGLLHDLIGAYVHGALEIDDLARDDAQGRPGWGVILDVDECPVKGLPWLGQIAGVTLRAKKQVTETNLVTYPDWEPVTARWVAGDGATDAQVDRVAGLLNRGHSWRGRLTSIGAGLNIWADYRQAMTIYPGKQYTVSLDVLAQSNPTNIVVQWYAGASFIDSTDETFPQNYATRHIVTSTAPAGADTLVVTLNLPPTAPGGFVDFDALTVQPTVESGIGEYVAGDQPGGAWTGAEHASASTVSRLETDDEWAVYARDAIRRQGGKGRGMVDAMLSAAEDTLTGTRSGRIVERVGGNAYALELITRPSETPDPTATLAAAMTQKPAGMSLVHTLTEGAVIDEGTVSIDTATGQIDTATIDDLT